jgi:hypothetical protein
MDVKRTQCVKVDALRKEYPGEDIDLEKWMAKLDCLYVGRRGRVSIKYNDGSTKVFVYGDSDWRNPFKVGTKNGQHTLETSLQLYRKHVLESDLRHRLHELEGKILGCFCDQKGGCHAKILIELYDTRDNLPQKCEVEVRIQPVEVVQEVEDNTCSAMKKDGKRCCYKAKVNGKCGIHSK